MPQVSVSIVIVSMNKPDVLAGCLDSIRRDTSVSYEALVVAYLYSADNLRHIRARYPWATFIESHEIRGFSENNNLALRQAKGEYCMILNDDTIVHPHAIDTLVASYETLPAITAIVSPIVVDNANNVTFAGREKITFCRCIRDYLMPRAYKQDIVPHGTEPYRTYNILGAAFMIRTEVFKSMGWFDEYYFFTPEDIAVSSWLNEAGYQCFVQPNATITHLEGLSSGKSLSKVQTATMPAGTIGAIHLVGQTKPIREYTLRTIIIIIFVLKFIHHSLKSRINSKPNHYQTLARGDLNTITALCLHWTPKQAFLHFYGTK